MKWVSVNSYQDNASITEQTLTWPKESVEVRPSQNKVDAGLVVEVAEHAQDVWVPQVGL